MKEFWIMLGSKDHIPWPIFMLSIALLIRLVVVDKWKNFVFKLVLVSQVRRDFYFQSSSSLFKSSLRFSCNCSSRFLLKGRHGEAWILMRASLRDWIFDWMWPKLSLFQLFRAFFVALSVLLRIKAGVSRFCWSQAFLTISTLEGSHVQNSSNLKGFQV